MTSPKRHIKPPPPLTRRYRPILDGQASMCFVHGFSLSTTRGTLSLSMQGTIGSCGRNNDMNMGGVLETSVT